MTGLERDDRDRSWFGNLPSLWERARIKSIAKRVTDGAHISPETDSGVFDFVSTRDITSGVIDFDGALKTNPESYAYMVQTGCKPTIGDVLFSKDGSIGVTALVAKDHNFVVASSLIIVSPDARRMDSRFLNFAFSARPVIEQAKAFTRGAGLPRISIANLARIEIPLPPLDEQRAIADYLDKETAQIDALVAKQEEFIGLLWERRSGLIAAEVTGRKFGEEVDNNASWLGNPPAGWLLGQIKHFGAVTLGKMLQNSGDDDDIFAPYMRAANVQPDGVMALEDVKSMWFNRRELRSLDLRAGDVVVVEGGIGGYGRAAFIAESLEGWGFQNSINRIRPFNDNDGRYLTYFLIMARHGGFITAYCNIVSMPHLTAEKLAVMPMFLPPPDEQREIANRIDDQTSRIDTLIAKAEEHIALAKERRSALITAAVTGQFDVRTGRKAS